MSLETGEDRGPPHRALRNMQISLVQSTLAVGTSGNLKEEVIPGRVVAGLATIPTLSGGVLGWLRL